MAVINTNLLSLNGQSNLGRSQSSLATALERLSSGLRINGAKDDAAGQAIANRMEANLRANDTVTRGINDGISLMQTAEGGLNGINEILQRSRELAVQAANGTLTDADRDSLNAEYKELRAEIDRIALGTEAFGKYPLAPAAHGGSEEPMGETLSLKGVFGTSGTKLSGMPSGIEPIAFIPAGATNVTIIMDGLPGAEDDIQLFSRDGKHLVGTPILGDEADITWVSNGIATKEDVETKLLKEENGFPSGVEYSDTFLLHYQPEEDDIYDNENGITGTYNGMTFTYTGDGDRFSSDTDSSDGSTDAYHAIERLHIDKVTEPLFLAITGMGIFDITADWESMPSSAPAPVGNSPVSREVDIVTSADFGNKVSKVTIDPTPSDHVSLGLEDVELDPIEKAREAMTKLQEALNQVDGYRSQYGALQNRFESAIANLATQSLNTAAAQSRIMDADYAKESAAMVKGQILQQAGTSVLTQANQIPQNVLSLLGSFDS